MILTDSNTKQQNCVALWIAGPYLVTATNEISLYDISLLLNFPNFSACWGERYICVGVGSRPHLCPAAFLPRVYF